MLADAGGALAVVDVAALLGLDLVGAGGAFGAAGLGGLNCEFGAAGAGTDGAGAGPDGACC